MKKNVHLIGISGSLRKGSFNTQLLHNLTDLLPADVTLEVLSFADLPLYNADIDTPASKERPGTVVTFRNTLSKGDGLVIISPEYNYSIPGGLKNAIDWASRGEDSPLIGLPVSIMGATTGMWGTTRMQLSFQAVFQYLDMKPVYKPEILVANAKNKFDQKGSLMDDDTKKLIKQNLENLKYKILHA